MSVMQNPKPVAAGLRLLYVGNIGSSGNGLDKRRALQSLGVELESFDIDPYRLQGSRLLRSLAHRANLGPAVSALNRDLLLRARGLSEVDLVWVDKGQWLWPETLRELRERWGCQAVHFANDSMLHLYRSRHFIACLPIYDVMFTTKRWEIEEYRRLGARRVHMVYDAVDDRRFQPLQVSQGQRQRFGSDVTFIGRCEPHYARCLRTIAGTGVDLRVWGPDWPRHARLHRWARSAVRGSGVWFDEYPVALSAARIGLGLLTKLVPDDHTTRTFEIPACGTFLLAERTPAHQELYEEGQEAEFFEEPGELVEKIRHYLDHPDARGRVAAAGRERYLRSGYNRRSRFGEMLDLVAQGPASGADRTVADTAPDEDRAAPERSTPRGGADGSHSNNR